MKTHLIQPITLILLILVGAAGLAACSNPTPIPVYVTPTPAATDPPMPTLAPPSPTTDAPQGTDTVLVADAPTLSPTPPPPTRTMPPGVTYGPITGPNYTLEPLASPLPPEMSVRPCPVVISAPEVSLYAAPDKNAQVTGTATERMKLTVSQLATDSAGNRWASTPGGWMMLADGGTEQARLGPMRACDILLGVQADTTLAGLHIITDTGHDQVIALVRRLKDAGHPMGTIKGVNGTEALLNEVKSISPETVVVFRSLLTPAGMTDCPAEPGQYGDPVTTAQQWMAGLKQYWDQVNADYYEFINECPVSLDWTAQFSVEAMRIANEQGRCLLLFSFPGGNPELNVFDQLLPAYRYAAENPCAPGRTHGIALHAYSREDDKLLSESNVWIAFRHRIFYQRLLVTLPEAAGLPVYLTEAGIGGGTFLPPCDVVVRDAIQFTYQLEEDPYIKGFHLWSVGAGAQWYDITPCLDDLGTQLIRYYSGG